jgi:hypothetical protein
MIGIEQYVVITRKESIVENADIGKMRRNFGNGWLRDSRQRFVWEECPRAKPVKFGKSGAIMKKTKIMSTTMRKSKFL